MAAGSSDASFAQGPRRAALALALSAALALACGLRGLGAPAISDDAAAIGYVHREGAFADWTQAWYGMRAVRFWRPAVTTTLDVQERLTGGATAPLRALNLAGHVATALLCCLLARRLGAGALGQGAAGALAATFPEIGGTVVWISGRVDSQTVPLVLGACLLAGSARWSMRALAAAVALVACASKEVAFAAPAIGALLALAAPGAGWRAAARAFLPLALGAGVAFLARRAALGEWVGGYPAPPPDAAGLVRAVGVALRALWLPVGVGALALVLGAPPGARRAAWRSAGLAALAACAALAPLVPLLQSGALEPQNRRVLFLADALCAVAAGAGLRAGASSGASSGAGASSARVRIAALSIALAVAARAVLALADAREWTAAAELAERREMATRAALDGFAPSDDPVLDPTLPRLFEGAYCIAWGAADRFRAPFPPAPRPVWPLRVMFVQHRPGDRERASAYEPRGHLVDPFAPARRRLPEIPTSVAGERDFGTLWIDLDVARGGGPSIEVLGALAPGTLEAVVYTELGYEVAALGPTDAERSVVGSDGVPVPVREVSLARVLRAHGLATLGDALLQAADAGATRALLELRAVDGEGRVLGVSRMIWLEWESDLPERIERAGGG